MASRFISDEIIKSNNKTPVFSLDGQWKYGKVVSVYDGDSCKVVFGVEGLVRRMNIRMYGYDSPELRQKEKGAIEARDRLKELVLDRIVLVECMKFDKYGRLLANLYLVSQPWKILCCFFLPPKCLCFGTKMNINARMVEEGHGYEYFGGTKRTKEKGKEEEISVVVTDEGMEAAMPINEEEYSE